MSKGRASLAYVQILVVAVLAAQFAVAPTTAEASITSPVHRSTVRAPVTFVGDPGGSAGCTGVAHWARISISGFDARYYNVLYVDHPGPYQITWPARVKNQGYFIWEEARKADCSWETTYGRAPWGDGDARDLRIVSLQNQSHLAYTGATSGMAKEPVNASATVSYDGWTLDGELFKPKSTVSFCGSWGACASRTTNLYGHAAVDLAPPSESGSYTVRASIATSAYFVGSSVTTAVTISKRPTTLVSSSDASVYAHAPILAQATLADARTGAPLEGKTVAFDVRDGSDALLSTPATTDAAGLASATLPADVVAGSYTVWSTFSGDGTYEASSNDRPLTVVATPTSLSYTGETSGDRTGSATLSARLTAVPTGAGIAGQPVTFTLGSLTLSATTDADGTATVAAPLSQPAGTYTVRAAFTADGYYVGSTGEAGFEIRQRSVVLTYTGPSFGYVQEPVALSARLTDGVTGAGLAGLQVAFTGLNPLQGTVYATTDADGVARVSQNTIDFGPRTIDTVFSGDGTYAAASDRDSFDLRRIPTAVEYTGDTTGYSLDTATYRARVVDTRTGQGIGGLRLLFLHPNDGRFNREALTAADGTASVGVSLPQSGTVDLVVRNDVGPARTYVISQDSFQLVIAPRPTTIAFTGDSSGYWSESARLSATLTDVRTGAGIDGSAVRLRLGSAEHSGSTASGGTAAVQTDLSEVPGEWTAAAEFAGDAFRAPAAPDSATFQILRRPTTLVYEGDVNGTRHHTATLRGTLTDSRSGAGLGSQPVSFSLGTLSADAETDAGGTASANVVLDHEQGEWAAVAEFAGDPYYEPASCAAPFTISWEYTFRAQGEAGIVYLNTSTKELRLETGDGLSDIYNDPGMIVVSLPSSDVLSPSWPAPCTLPLAENCDEWLAAIAFTHPNMTLVGTFELHSGAFGAVASTSARVSVLAAGPAPPSPPRAVRA